LFHGVDVMALAWVYVAFRDLMNRALDKPAQQVSVKGHDAGPILIKWQEPF